MEGSRIGAAVTGVVANLDALPAELGTSEPEVTWKPLARPVGSRAPFFPADAKDLVIVILARISEIG